MRKVIIMFIACCVWLGILSACNTTSNNQGNDIVTAEPTQEVGDDNGMNLGGDHQDNVSNDNTPDLAGETIVLHLIGDTEPPFTSITSPMRNAAADYVEFINENGGVFGAEVELRFADTGGSDEGAVTVYQRYVNSDDPVLIIISYGGYGVPLYEHVNDDRIPILTVGLNPESLDVDDGSYVYQLAPSYAEQFVFFLEYVLENWEDIKPDGAVDEIKVAYISWDNDYGRSGVTEESREYIEGLGIDIVLEEYLQMSDLSSSTSAIFNAEIAGTTVVYTNSHDFGPANLLNDLNNLAIRDFFIVGGNNLAFDAGMLEYLFDPGFAEDFFIPSWYAWWTDTENKGIQLAEDILESNGRAEMDKGVGRLLIQGGLDLALYAVRQAILQEGYEKLSGTEIKKTLDEISAYEVMNGLFTVDFSTGNQFPSFLQIRQVQGDAGVLVTVEDFSEIPDF